MTDYTNNINDIIIEASNIMDKGEFETAINIIDKGIFLDKNNYELAFMKAICYEQLQDIEYAFYWYKLAIFLAKNTEDEEVIKQACDNMCSYALAEGYKLGKALQRLIEYRIHIKEYVNTQQFLKEILYVKNSEHVNIVATSNNMMLFMMIEIHLCEEKSGVLEQDGVFSVYQENVEKFKKVFTHLRFLLRRIRFGFAQKYWHELKNIISDNKVSGDMMAVIIEYCIEPVYWYDVMDKVSLYLKNEYKHMAEKIDIYKKWLSLRKDIIIQKCMPEDDYDNGAKIIELDCNIINLGEKLSVQENSISIIFCTNDKIYEEECVRYLKRLRVPSGMKLIIIKIYNASGMAFGYNKAMEYSPSKYKLYIHHDTFIVDVNILEKLVNIFEKDSNIGLIGNSGTINMPDDGVWWSDSDMHKSRINLYQDMVLNVSRMVSTYKNGVVEYADAIDGIFMATSKDVRWREDIFDKWHFYDISQSYEFRKAGYETVFMNDDKVTLLHEVSTDKNANYENDYEKYRQRFVKEYLQ